MILGIYHWFMNFLAHISGYRNESGPVYGFWSGFGGAWVLGYAGLGLGFLWHAQCHVTHCYWPARRITAAGDRACWRHHPHKKITEAMLLKRHRDAEQS